jgi:hypothetical protein
MIRQFDNPWAHHDPRTEPYRANTRMLPEVGSPGQERD